MKQMRAFVAVITGEFLAENERHIQRDYRGSVVAAPMTAAAAPVTAQ